MSEYVKYIGIANGRLYPHFIDHSDFPASVVDTDMSLLYRLDTRSEENTKYLLFVVCPKSHGALKASYLPSVQIVDHHTFLQYICRNHHFGSFKIYKQENGELVDFGTDDPFYNMIQEYLNRKI